MLLQESYLFSFLRKGRKKGRQENPAAPFADPFVFLRPNSTVAVPGQGVLSGKILQNNIGRP